MPESALQRLANSGGSRKRLSAADFDTSPSVTGERSMVATVKATHPFVVREGVPYDLHLPAYQEASTDANTGDEETISLDHSAVEAASVADPVVVYEDGNDVTADISVDYDADEITYTDPGADSTLDIWYISDDQAKIEVRKEAPKNVAATLEERDAGLVNLREQTRDPLDFSFNDPAAGVIPTDWRLVIYVDASYPVKWENPDTGATARNSLVSLPIYLSAAGEVPGLGDLTAGRIREV